MRNIEIEMIEPHPDNPRKDLGDLTELADSIRVRGILQNLTVIPTDEALTSFRVVIGHRRLAAAKLAGLTTVPCSIAQDMNHREQVATMLLENMQRSDLTIYEQAQGFQMMLDLGETVSDIAKKTGFSQKTVKHRVKLTELDQEKLKKSVERGATLMDFAELEKLEDVGKRNELLAEIGGSGFKWMLQRAVDNQKWENQKSSIVAELETFAAKVNEPDHQIMAYEKYISAGSDFKKPADAGERKYWYQDKGSFIQLYSERAADAEGARRDTEYAKRQERRARLDEAAKQAYQMRLGFVKDIQGCKEHARDIIEFAARVMLDYGFDVGDTVFKELSEIGEDDVDSASAHAAEIFVGSPERMMLYMAYSAIDGEHMNYHDYGGEHDENEELDALYAFLERLDYTIAPEERALMDGTHELYKKDEEAA